MKRVGEFLRSVIPEDPFQLLFLFGAVFVFISPRLGWFPRNLVYASNSPLAPQLEALRAFMSIGLYPVIFAGLAGYFLCFWPGKRPLRRLILSVYVPGFGALVAWFFLVAFWMAPYQSVVARSQGLQKYAWLWALLGKLPSGFHFTFLGLALISAFAIRLALGKSHLPLALPEPRASCEDVSVWRQTRILIYVLIGPFFLVGFLFLPFTLFPEPWLSSTARFSPFLDGTLFLGISMWLARASGRELARRSVRLPELKFAALGGAIALGLGCLIPMTRYVIDRAQWAAHDFGRFAPPQLRAYFNPIEPWLLLMAVGAFVEEVIFRGVLQPRFMERYGVQRGIFVTTIVWAAIHFRGDSYGPGSDGAVLFHLGFRTCSCVALGYVFAWLTLRSGSVIPSGISHSVHNIFVFSQVGQEFPGSREILIALWAVAAYLLFRYWPVSKEGSLEPVSESAVSEGAL